MSINILKKLGRRFTAFLLIMMMFFQITSQAVLAVESLSNASKNSNNIDNNYVLCNIQPENGRFTIKTKEGSLIKKNDNDKKLLFEEQEPETSFTTFRINGEDYIYGNKYGFMNLDGTFLQKPSNHGNEHTNSSVWKIGDVEITQHLELIDDNDNPNAGNVKIRYEVANKGNESAEIGTRILLDTMLDSNDGAAVVLGTDLNPITHERELAGNDIPQYWRSMDDTFAPNVMAYGLIDGWGNAKPDKMTIGHYDGLSSTKWDYQVDSSLKFTDKSNKYGGADSAVALYWTPVSVKPQSTYVFETYYGIGDIGETVEDANYTVKLHSIDKLTVNDDKDDYKEDTFKITAELDNTLEEAKLLEDVQVSLILDNGLEVEKGEVPYKHINKINANKIRNFQWRIHAKPQQTYKMLKYRVDITTKGQSEPISYSGYILAPGLKGEPPKIQYQNITPSKMYYEGMKLFTIKGKGYNFYSDKSRWNMYLQSKITEKRILISQQYINVSGDDRITITYPEDLELGDYQVILKHNALPDEEILPYTLSISDDKKYRTRAYGILCIVKNVPLQKTSYGSTAQDFTYNIITVQDEDALIQLRHQTMNANEQIKNSGSGTLKEILMEVRGDVLATGQGENHKFIVNTDNIPATINGVMQYSGEPLVIEQDVQNAKITINGDGPVKVTDGFTFWKWAFGIELKNGIDYSLNAKTEEDIAEIDPDGLSELIAQDIEYLYVRDKERDAQRDLTLEFLGMGTVAKYMGGFLIQIENVVLKKKAVAFDGQLALTFLPNDNEDPFALSTKIDEVMFQQNKDGKTAFKGLDFTTNIELPENMLGGILNNEASASLTIDTIDNVYSIESDMKVKTIECHGKFTIAFTENDKPVLDDLELSAPLGKRIPVFPPQMYINSLGGGINDLYGTVTGDKTAPPLKILLMAGIELIGKNLFEGDVKLTISKVGFSLSGDLELVTIHSTVLENAHVSARWANPWYFELGADLDILGMLEGRSNFYVSGEWFKGRVHAALKIPNSIPLIGGEKFSGVDMGANKDKIWGNVEIEIPVPRAGIPPWTKKEIGVGVAYYWDGGLKVADAGDKLGAMPLALYSETFFDENNEPITMLVGTNITKVADSSSEVMFASKQQSFDMPMVYATLDNTEHFFKVYNQEVAVFQLDYKGEVPDINVYRPDGTEYPLVDNEGNKAYIVQEIPAEESVSGEPENHVYIFIPEPTNGQWKVSVSKSVDTALLEIKQPPTLDSVTAVKTDDKHIKVDWTASNADEALINISLAADKEEAGVLLSSDVNASEGAYTVEIPQGTPEGNYYVKVEIKEGNYGYQRMYSDSIHVTDPYMPPAVNDNISISLEGNGTMGVSFTPVSGENIEGYYIEVFDETGAKVDTTGEYFVEEGQDSIVIGGQYKANTGDNSEEVLGLEPGKSYKIGITTLRQREGYQHLSSTTYSDSIFLPVPEPAILDVQWGSEFIDVEDEQGNQIKGLNKNEGTLHFISDQTVDTIVKVNNNVYETFVANEKDINIPVEDGKYVVEFIAKNEKGDTSTYVASFMVDTTAPVLMIENPAQDTVISTENIYINGVSEKNATITVNGKQVIADENGRFEYSLPMGDKVKESILIQAIDNLDNETTYETEVINSAVGTIQNVYIRPETEQMTNGISKQFYLIGVDGEGKEYILDDSMVEWSFMAGETLAELSTDGLLRAYKEGEVVIKASYYISEQYAFEDAMTIEIIKNDMLDNIQDVAIRPRIKEIDKGSMQQFRLMGIDVESKEIEFEQDMVKWTLAEGDDVAELSTDGLLRAYKEGEVELKAVCKIGDNTFNDTVKINIINNNNTNNTNDKDEEKPENKISSKLQKILDGIIAREKGLIVLATSNVNTDKDNNIKYGKSLSITVPKEAISQNDALMVAKVKDNTKYLREDSEQKFNQITDIYEIQFAKSNQSLKKPVEVEFGFDSSKVKNLKNIGVYYYNKKYSEWEYLGGKVEGNGIKVTIPHFSKYAVLESKDLFNVEDIEERWSEDCIKKLISLQIVNGVQRNGRSYFEPSRRITRLELATMVTRVMRADMYNTNISNPPFTDWDDIAQWGKPYAKVAYHKGWILGKESDKDKIFAPEEYATRAEVATIIGRLMNNKVVASSNFKDENNIPVWAKEYVNRLVSKGIISGYTDGTFKPNKNITREEVAKMFSIFIEQER